jgi:hypothetical protein
MMKYVFYGAMTALAGFLAGRLLHDTQEEMLYRILRPQTITVNGYEVVLS